jgi:hypothetical protein
MIKTEQSRVIEALIGPGQAKKLIRQLWAVLVLLAVCTGGLLWVGRWLYVERSLANAERAEHVRQWAGMNEAKIGQDERHASEMEALRRELDTMRTTFARAEIGIRWIERKTDRAGLPSIFEEGDDYVDERSPDR